MNKKYHITESQMKRLVSHIKVDDTEIIEEGWKEVALGAALILGVTFGNEAKAQEANKAVDNVEILQNIKTTLEDDEGVARLADYLSVGDKIITPEQLSKYMITNAEKVESDFELAAKKKNANLSITIRDGSGGVSNIKNKIKRSGYAVSDIEITNDTMMVPGDVVWSQTVVDLFYSNDDMFVTAKYELKSEVLNSINQTISDIQSMDGKIVSVNIEASTDKEPIKMGNEQLAQNRANSVKSVLNSFGISSEVGIELLPNQGPDVYSKTMSNDERVSARQQTSEYRYVKVSFTVEVSTLITVNEPLYEVIESVNVKLIRTTTKKDGGGDKVKRGKNKKTKCIKVKHKGKTKLCPAYGG
jgi:outer membrane protein OmpA-like peptidoglycan-associated protein